MKSAAVEGGVVNTGVGTEGLDIPIPEVDVEGGTDVEGEVDLEPKVVEDDEVRVGGGEAVLELTVVGGCAVGFKLTVVEGEGVSAGEGRVELGPIRSVGGRFGHRVVELGGVKNRTWT